MKEEVRILFDVLEAHGVRSVVCSPGSRNTPLLLEAARRETLRKHVVADERCAAFIALGMAAAGRRPVAICCTSGTALLNYAPAVAEAYYQGVPLIVVSADRPMEWIDQDDSQTIRQPGALANFVKASYDITADSGSREYRRYTARTVNEGMLKALEEARGPVHFNIHLADPLAHTAPEAPETAVIDILRPAPVLPPETMDRLAAAARGKKILLVAGFMSPDPAMHRAVMEFGKLPQGAVMAETISNLDLPSWSYMIDATFAGLGEGEEEELRPDIVLSAGGALVSRKLKEFLRGCRETEHWCIGRQPYMADCFRHLTMRIEADPALFISGLAERLASTGAGDYNSRFTALQKRAVETYRTRYATDREWSDWRAYELLLRSLPEGCRLSLSNGTTVRYAQIIPLPRQPESYCNRGVSGIDGCTSTAIGTALADGNRLNVLLTGDMSFAYDIGALGTRLAPATMRIAVICNGGGGIFRFIGTTASLPERDQYFCADPRPPVEGLARAYGWQYDMADNEESLRDILDDFYSPSTRPRILEVRTPGEASAARLRRFFGMPDGTAGKNDTKDNNDQ